MKKVTFKIRRKIILAFLFSVLSVLIFAGFSFQVHREIGNRLRLLELTGDLFLLAKILSQYHFKVDIKGDLVVAKVLHLPREDLEHRLRVLGRLIGFTRQLDIQLRSDEDVPEFVEAFFEQNGPSR